MQILQISKELLKEEQKEADEENTKGIQNALNEINNQINSLNYVLSALENVNTELAELSADNEDQKIRFIAGESDAGKLLNNLTLSFSTGNNLLSIGGDGRNNQIFLATWIAKQNIQKNVDHVTFYAVEEPEAHLHPHQQRKTVEQKKAMARKEKKPSIHERLEINKRIIQEKQGKDKPARGADLSVRTV